MRWNKMEGEMHAPLDLLDVLFPLTFGSMVAGWEGGVNWCSGVSPRAESREQRQDLARK